ncbi:MAG: phosphoribosylaminoimidazolesuccinocarboxamide synthase [Tissierellales bacterium]|jgi:phosphoribosylaminoimidazole-succinocarboxamide synthase|nr:phosphoribosylaminoimidazolesuccinocarboxamide synthase [Tissierellales bacterium]
MKKELLYEGKAKKVYKTDIENEYIVDYKDDATAFNGVKKGTIEGKGQINNQMSNFLFKMLEKEGIKTHFVKEISERETIVKAVEILPLEVIVRNVAAGSFCKRFGIEEGRELKQPILEFCYKNDDLGDPMINDDQIYALELATKEDLATIRTMTFKVNELLKAFFDERNVRLIDFKLEFGRYEDEILLADEISPDTCRFWDKTTGEKLDKDRFRRDLGGVIEHYREVFSRIGE